MTGVHVTEKEASKITSSTEIIGIVIYDSFQDNRRDFSRKSLNFLQYGYYKKICSVSFKLFGIHLMLKMSCQLTKKGKMDLIWTLFILHWTTHIHTCKTTGVLASQI